MWTFTYMKILTKLNNICAKIYVGFQLYINENQCKKVKDKTVCIINSDGQKS